MGLTALSRIALLSFWVFATPSTANGEKRRLETQISVYKKAKITKEHRENEKLGKYEVEFVKPMSKPAKSAKVKNELVDQWASFVIDHFNREKNSVGDDIEWLKGLAKLLPVKHREITRVAMTKSGGHAYGVISLTVKSKHPHLLTLCGILLLRGDLEPFEIKNLFVGTDSDGENRRVVQPTFFADVNDDGFLDIVLRDERYAGASEKIMFVDKNSNLKGPLKTQSVHADAWD